MAGTASPPPEVVERLKAEPDTLALMPPSRVNPTVKVLPVDGADLFGGPAARSADYPITGRALGVEPYDPNEIRTLISLGDSCPDRGVAYAALTQGRGWDWVFGGGTAEYTAVYPNPVPPGFVGNGFNIVDAVRTGNEGAVAELVSGADITVDDFECPVVDDFTVNDGVVFSIDPAVLPRLRDTYGVDVATLAANHLFDRGTPGFLETLQQFDDAGIPTTGAGADLDGALEPAYVDVNGLTFGFVAFNEVPGSLEAGVGQPGVLWLRDENVTDAVSRAREGGADLVFCVPQWWGGAEYHASFVGDMRRQQQFFFDAGCDQVIGHGTHWSGPIEIGTDADGRRPRHDGQPRQLPLRPGVEPADPGGRDPRAGVPWHRARPGQDAPVHHARAGPDEPHRPLHGWAVRPQPDLRGVGAERGGDALI